MRLAPKPRTATALGVAALLLGGAVPVAAPAAADAQTITYDCRASTVFGPVPTTLDSTVDATAPGTVPAGGAFSVTVTPQPDQVPTTAANLPLREIRDVALTIPIPANATLTSAILSGGAGLPGTPDLVVGESAVVITMPGSLAGGADYQLPALTLDLVAGQEGTVDVRVGGTSYEDPGLALTAVIDVLGSTIEAPTACFPDPSPVLASTTVTPA